ncbi:MAG TPA: hypothetical protein VFK34_13130 [Marmoricola sp.]|jgi:hypothetical protein|nr:hypothetical protein [Marmoricola sp.]
MNYWPAPDDPWREPPSTGREHELFGRVRHVVYLEGRFLDTWTEPVEGSGYERWADELDRRERPIVFEPEPPSPPVHERVLAWLDSVVGGRVALLALDDSPGRVVARPETAGERYDEVLACIARTCDALFDADFQTATSAALAALVSQDPPALDRARSSADVAAGLVWLVGRANGAVGPGAGITQKQLRQVLWLKSSPGNLATRYKGVLRGLAPDPGYRPQHCPDLLELGSPDFLTPSTRRDLVGLRDRALLAAERAWADAVARGEAPPTPAE